MADQVSIVDEQLRALAIGSSSRLATTIGLAPRYSRVRSAIAPQLPAQPSFNDSTPLSEEALSERSRDNSWLREMLTEIEELRAQAKKSGFVPPTEDLVQHAKRLVLLCDESGLSEPVLDLREGGQIEIFCREGGRGLLLVLNPDDLLQVFGDFLGDQWRARYHLQGETWQRYLRQNMRDLSK